MGKIGAVADDAAEDMIRAITQIGCAEVHAKTLLEKFTAELENGIIDPNDTEAVNRHVEMITDMTEEIQSLAELRRATQMALFNLFPPKDEEDRKIRLSQWCSLKHLAVASYTLFEAYQATEDASMLTLSLEANKRLTKAITRFLGIPISDCAACLADALKANQLDAKH